MKLIIQIPCFNEAATLPETIVALPKSVSGFDRVELLIVDDGSGDNSLDRAREWQGRDQRVRGFQHPDGINKGVSASRNLAIAHSRGTYLAMLDSDDKWLPGKLAQDIGIFQEHPDVVFIYSKAEVIDETGQSLKGSSGDDYDPRFRRRPYSGVGIPGKVSEPFEKVMKRDISVPTSSVIFLKEAGAGYDYFDETTGDVEDTLLWYQLLEQGSMYFIDRITAQYRIHPLSWNATHKNREKLVGRRLKLYLYLIKTVQPGHRSIVSYNAVDVGFRLIVRNFLIYPRINWKFIVQSFQALKAHKDIQRRHLPAAVWVVILEILKLPFRPLNVLKKWLKH